MTNHDIYTISIALNYTEGHLRKRVQSPELLWQNIESLSKTPTLKCGNPYGIVFVCLSYLVVDNSQISISYHHLPPQFPHVLWTFSSGCYPFALIHQAWKQTHNFCPPPLIYTFLRLAHFYLALLFLPFWF